MKILHVQHSLDPRSGGPSEALRELVAHQTQLGLKVQITATDAQTIHPWSARQAYVQGLHEDPRFFGVGLYIGKAYGRSRPWSRFSFSPACARHLREKFADPQRRPDVVHIHGVFSHLTHAAAIEARRFGIPYLIRPAGSLNANCLKLGSSWLKTVLLRKGGVAEDLRLAAALHATSERERDELQAFAPGVTTEVIPHGLRLPEPGTVATAAFYTQFPDLRRHRYWLYMSRIAPKKRLDLLLEAFAQRRVAGSKWHLVIAGTEDGLQASVRRIIRQHQLADVVHFTGFLQGAVKQGAIQGAEAVALTSEDENFGVIIVEAMGHGKPVLVTPGVDTHRYVQAAEAGIITAYDARQIADDMEKLERTNRGEMGQRGRVYAEAHLSWHSTCQRLLDLYRHVVSHAHDRSLPSLTLSGARQRHRSHEERIGQHPQMPAVG